MNELDYRARERLVLFAGAATVALLALVLVAEIAGTHLGSGAGKLVTLLLLFYACARIATHAKTIEERRVHEQLARLAWAGSPVIFLVLAAQTVKTHTPRITFSGLVPSVALDLWTRIEWTADVAVFALFLVTCMAVWVVESDALSRRLSRIAYGVVALLAVVLLFAIWASLLTFAHHFRLSAGLVVLSLAGTLLVAILRRVERLDEWDGGGPAAAATEPPQPGPIATLTPQP